MAGMDALEMLGLDEMVRTERLYVPDDAHPPTPWAGSNQGNILGVREVVGYIS